MQVVSVNWLERFTSVRYPPWTAEMEMAAVPELVSTAG